MGFQSDSWDKCSRSLIKLTVRLCHDNFCLHFKRGRFSGAEFEFCSNYCDFERRNCGLFFAKQCKCRFNNICVFCFCFQFTSKFIKFVYSYSTNISKNIMF